MHIFLNIIKKIDLKQKERSKRTGFMYILHHFTEGTLHFDICGEFYNQSPKLIFKKLSGSLGQRQGSHKKGGHQRIGGLLCRCAKVIKADHGISVELCENNTLPNRRLKTSTLCYMQICHNQVIRQNYTLCKETRGKGVCYESVCELFKKQSASTKAETQEHLTGKKEGRGGESTLR